MQNSEYWKRRFLLLEESLSGLGLDYWRDLEKEYRRAIVGVESDISYWYQKFAANNEISFADAKKLLNSKELEEFKWTVDDYIKYGEANLDGQWTKQLVNASSRVHISRFSALETMLRQKAEVLAASFEVGLTALGSTIYTEAYYHTAYEIQKGLNIGWQVAVDENRIKKVLSKPWTLDGKTFSDRIWTNKQELLGTIKRELTQAVIRGDSPDKAIQVVTDRFTANKNQAARLIMTESSFFAAASIDDCYDALNVEKYRIVATLDLKTSIICRGMDGKVFDKKDYKPGVTANPFHPWCRTTTCPHTDGSASLRMARDPVTGKSEYVPGDITFREWYQKFVIDKYGEGEANKMQKMSDNETRDRDQYQAYKEVLGKDAPKTFEDFQDLKYNNSDYHDFLRLDYRRRNTLLEHPERALPGASEVIVAPEKFTDYLFNPDNANGYAKGTAFTNRLGYDSSNWKSLQREITKRAPYCPATSKGNNGFGDIFEQKMIIYGQKETPANVVVGWIKDNAGTRMTTVYIKEV